MEDAFCSGRQILSVFETYMGIPLNERHTKEVHVEELSNEQKEKLKSCKLFFSFVYYEKSNEDYFYRQLCKIGLKNVKIIANQSFPKGYFKQLFNEEEQTELSVVENCLRKVGEKLIKFKATDENGNRKNHWTDERICNSTLGYNDAQQFDYSDWPSFVEKEPDNMPDFTEEELLTVLWEDKHDYGYGCYCFRMWPAACVCSASKNQERALDLITAIYTDKALSDLFIYGVEDVDYTIDENGRVVKRDFNYLTMLYFGNSLIATDFCDAPKAYNIDKQNKMQKNPYLDFEVTDSSVEGGIDDSSMTLIYDGIEEIKDFDEVIAQVRTELNESGAEQYIEGINKSLEEYMKGRE